MCQGEIKICRCTAHSYLTAVGIAFKKRQPFCKVYLRAAIADKTEAGNIFGLFLLNIYFVYFV